MHDSLTKAIEALFSSVQEASLPGIWSKGVALARENAVLEDSIGRDEIIVRVLVKDRPVSPKATLWPFDDDSHCDCGDRNEPCIHIVAAVVAAKTGKIQSRSHEGIKNKTSIDFAQIRYRFNRQDGSLSFDRLIVRSGKEEILSESLVSFVGGIHSGRIQCAPVAATKADFAVDAILGQKRRGILDRATICKLIPTLRECANIELDGTTVSASNRSISIRCRITDDGDGIRVHGIYDDAVKEVFKNGVALCGNVLRSINLPELTPDEANLLSEKGRFFSKKQSIVLLSEIIPSIKNKVFVEIESEKIPELMDILPRLVLHLEKRADATLAVTPRLVYGSPPIAQVHDDGLHILNERHIPIRNIVAEQQLIRKLQQQLHLKPDQVTTFDGPHAVEFTQNARGWDFSGSGYDAFSTTAQLIPSIELSADRFSVQFSTSKERVDAEAVVRAWRDGSSYISLLNGGWAALPKDWLERYGERIEALLSARKAHNKLPTYLLPDAVGICDEMEQPYPDTIKNLRKMLESFDGIPQAKLPSDLSVALRTYQRKGIDWLCFLRDYGIGALLADDMGLGKTLQALCATKGKTLVVAPTSVLYSWRDQIQRFRPELRYSIYHGNDRTIEENADITITTYSLLRRDRDALTRRHWETIVLDEAQIIKNPDSQVARAAHQLRADFRIALSGTPIENRLEDLWSLFQFLNPGLLGNRDAFQQHYVDETKIGERGTSVKLRAKIKPFVLRRLKREVTPELPPKTETVLQCELNAHEMEVYHSVLASTRTEVLKKLQHGGSVFAALEMLLRLRQACCHPALIPGQQAASSSKLELLLQTLESLIALEHKVLVFSQWTSLLDLIEPALNRANMRFLRLDGSTSNRQDVVNMFQSDGPPVLLMSLKAGGLGLTLTAADHVFLLDPWWNPAAEDQATDRAHRIGQTNPVFVHRMVAKDTIEERILALQERKRTIAGALFDNNANSVSITREDILELLE